MSTAVGQAAAAEVQQLEHLVEAGGVAGVLGADREQALEVAVDEVGLEQGLAGAHPVAVAPHGVDLAVVGDEAVRVRQRPARERVGREAAVDQRDRAGETGVGQVREVRGQLVGRQHALVDQGAAGQAREVHAGLALGALAHAERAPLQVHPARAAEEQLAHDRLDLAGRLADRVAADRHLAPAEQLQTLLADDLADELQRAVALARLTRQEGDADGVGPGLGERERRHLAKERIRDLHQHPGAVADLGVAAGRAAVVEVA